ncbi:hypothetical protein FNJ84_06395 [Paracoccus sp. M683]|uniref:anti-sigma factor n=1 Tax=Paracoccus sp. M683 TaxID=2594268 RepID=UPI00117D6A74|nr:zf-HC2 domain-containing protein [Paracoccus sp. M683]TRW98401.1 hypothetical protein FNJ84_06395 [Paracoccus sp. M683]
MTDSPPSDEILMAYADGMLDPAEAARVEAALARDPDLLRRVEAFRETGRRLKALAQAQDDSVPDTLIARVRELAAQAGDAAPAEAAPIIDLAAHRQAQDRLSRDDAGPAAARRVPIWQLPLAASIFLALGLWAGVSFGPQQAVEGPGASQLAVLDSAELDQALQDLPSGERQAMAGGGELAAIASFTDQDGRLCREFELNHPDRQTIVSVTCYQAGGETPAWSTQLAILAAPGSDTGYAPASSLDTLDAYLNAVGAGAPLSDEDEAAALAALH